MKADYINPFLGACSKIVNVVLGEDLTRGALSVRESHELSDILVIIIGIKGDFVGKVTLCFKQEIAFNIASNMMGERISELDEMAKSALGELANMILGRASTVFSNKGINVSISPPTIVQAAKLFITPAYGRIINIEMQLGSGDVFDVEVEIEGKE
ncbi:MAG: chemotaxis protein CheX [Clostridia bacterium]|nr:chemotaxis protein CheX [Clostridia bacterium]